MGMFMAHPVEMFSVCNEVLWGLGINVFNWFKEWWAGLDQIQLVRPMRGELPVTF